MWGDFEMLNFYPRIWQAGFFYSGSLTSNYLMMWQYWLFFSFIYLINIYFVFLFRTSGFRRADIRGLRAVGDKRRGAWPEIFTCFFPFLWCINILNNSLGILKMVETNGSYVALTLQIIGFQWGWKYNYGELNYTKFLLAPIKVGYDSVIRNGLTDGDADLAEIALDEAHWCRSWLQRAGQNPNYSNNWIFVPNYRPVLGITAQGTQATEFVTRTYIDGTKEFVHDPLRLLRATNTMVIPARLVVRLLATAEDVTHSWALPGLSVKLDCVPGRLFVSFLNVIRDGVYYGQCSELCGWNHYNMPIVLYALPSEHFIAWWELELHSIFQTKISDDLIHYKLLNVKYK